MKRKALLLLIVFVGMFSCKDETKENPILLPDASYTGNSLILTLNGKTINGKAIELVTSEEGQCMITLHDILPGENEIPIGVSIDYGKEGYSISGENKNALRALHAEGNIKEGILHMNLSFKIISEMVGKWKLARWWDDERTPTIFMELENDRIDTVKLPSLTWRRYPGAIITNPVVVPVRDTPDEILPERIEHGFPTYVTNNAITADACSMTVQEINFKDDGTLTVTYTDYSKPEPHLQVTTADDMIRYNLVDNFIWFATNEEPARCFPLRTQIVDGVLKISLDQNNLASFTALSPCLKSFIAYLDKINGIVLGYTSEESVREFVDVTLYDLVRTSQYFECGINLKRINTNR